MIQDKLVCPKCSTRSLRKAHGRNPIAEFFCDKDREYFTTWELVNIWGYDAGDFVSQKGVSLLPNDKSKMVKTWDDVEREFANSWVVKFKELLLQDNNLERLDTLDMFEGEPIWSSERERDETYEVVHRMFLGIPEFDDYQDLKNTQESALDIGIQ